MKGNVLSLEEFTKYMRHSLPSHHQEKLPIQEFLSFFSPCDTQWLSLGPTLQLTYIVGDKQLLIHSLNFQNFPPPFGGGGGMW